MALSNNDPPYQMKRESVEKDDPVTIVIRAATPLYRTITNTFDCFSGGSEMKHVVVLYKEWIKT